MVTYSTLSAETDQGRLDIAQAIWVKFATNVSEKVPLKSAKCQMLAQMQCALEAAHARSLFTIEVPEKEKEAAV